MCGINGFNFTDEKLIGAMNETTSHRGPDETNVWIGENISFGHNRLAIIDLSARGRQPMWDAAHEIVIVFNGEIYNYQELCAELSTEYVFNSASDTEVILNAYKKYGYECVTRFNGIFAFALYDTRTKELFLARDQVGVKPLYYYFDDGKFIFSSEIKGILAHDVPRIIDTEAFNLFFQVLYIPEPLTMFTGIKKLSAGHCAVLKTDKTLEIKQYWSTPRNPLPATSYRNTVKQVRTLFQDSVKRQLISDRPVGVFLSGGLDSTAILGAAVEFHKGQIDTFSVGFKDTLELEKFNADLQLAKKTAAHYKTKHHELLIGPMDLWNSIEKIAWHLDEPNFNPTAGAIYLLAAEAKKSVAVVLGGDGADELFGGYPRYYYSRLISLGRRFGLGSGLGLAVARFLGGARLTDKLKLPNDESRILTFLAQRPNILNQIISPEILNLSAATNRFHKQYFEDDVRNKDFENYFMHIDRKGWLVDESLTRTDTMTMAHGVEARVPILDYRLVELSETVPVSWKFSALQNPNNFQGKKIWKDAILPYLPPHVLTEKKRGWFTPMAKWLRTDLRVPVSEVLERSKKNTAYFNSEGIEIMWQKHLSGEVYNLNSIWAVVMWQLWYERNFKI